MPSNPASPSGSEQSRTPLTAGLQSLRQGWRGLALTAGLLAFVPLAWGLPMLIVLLAIIGMIFLHELGHYLTARAAGMKVTEFFLGFGPRLWSFRRRGDALWPQGHTRGGLRPDHRHEQSGGGLSRRGAPHLPQQALLAADVGGGGRLGGTHAAGPGAHLLLLGDRGKNRKRCFSRLDGKRCGARLAGRERRSVAR